MATKVERIREILEEVTSNPQDYDITKVANEIDSFYEKETSIAENMESYWANLNAGSAK